MGKDYKVHLKEIHTIKISIGTDSRNAKLYRSLEGIWIEDRVQKQNVEEDLYGAASVTRGSI